MRQQTMIMAQYKVTLSLRFILTASLRKFGRAFQWTKAKWSCSELEPSQVSGQ